MTGYSYRVPAYPVEPGSRPPKEDMVIATAWRIKSLITAPQANTNFRPGSRFAVRGSCWAGEETVKEVLVSTDFGMHWKKAALTPPANAYAWAHWECEVALPGKGITKSGLAPLTTTGPPSPFVNPESKGLSRERHPPAAGSDCGLSMQPRRATGLVILGSALALVCGLAAGEENNQPLSAGQAVQKPVIDAANPGRRC